MRSRPASQARSLTRFFVPLILTGQHPLNTFLHPEVRILLHAIVPGPEVTDGDRRVQLPALGFGKQSLMSALRCGAG